MSAHATPGETIATIIGWYQRRPQDYNDVDALIYSRKQLSCACFALAAEVGMLGTEKNRMDHMRRSGFATIRHERLQAGDSDTKAQAYAESQIIELRANEQAADAQFHAARLIYDSTMAVLDTMNQHIAHLRNEKRLETTGQGSQG
jgi:hypothetical protein